MLPVFDDYPGSENFHYDDRTGDYMDKSNVPLGEEDNHKIKRSEQTELLVVNLDGDADPGEDILDDLVIRPTQSENGDQLCAEPISTSFRYIGSRVITQAGSAGTALIWEVTTEAQSFFDIPEWDDINSSEESTVLDGRLATLSADIAGDRVQTGFSKGGLVKMPPPGLPASSAKKEPAFEVLDYYENRT